MKYLAILTLIILISGCQLKQTDHFFYVGTYTNGSSNGIYQYSLSVEGKLSNKSLVAETENPSYLALSSDKTTLVVVNENQEGTVESYKVIDDSLQFISRSSSGGGHPCYVTANEQGYVLVANYSGGSVGLLQLKSNGELSELLHVEQHKGKGTTSRQEAPHAHSARFIPNSNKVISVDLGTNELWFSKVNSLNKLLPIIPQRLKMKEGAGPRHMEFHPTQDWLYVVNELDCTVSLLKKTASGLFKIESSISTLPKAYDEPNTCADIHISGDGKFLYASNRGHNSIAIYNVNIETGELTFVAHESTKGKSPRNFSLSPNDEFLVVANQLTNNIISFKRDSNTGLITYIDEVECAAPVCILFK